LKLKGLVAALVLLSAAPLLAQPFTGKPFPLTNTRYGAMEGNARLVTDGHSTLMFWSTLDQIRVTKIVDGERRGGRAILESWPGADFDVVWSGRHYLLATYDLDGGSPGAVRVRLLDANGDPEGSGFKVAEEGTDPRIATNGETMLVLYGARQSSLRHSVIAADGSVKMPARLLRHVAEGAYYVASNGSGFAAVAGTQSGTHLLLFDGEGNVVSETMLAPWLNRDLAIVSNGRDYFVTWSNGNALQGVLVSADGDISRPLIVDPSWPYGGPRHATAWSGDSWVVAYRPWDDGLRFTWVDASVRSVIGIERGTWAAFAPSIVNAGGRLTVLWKTSSYGPGMAVVSQLPLPATGSGDVATWGAAEQQLLATASGSDSTLVMWSELVDSERTYRVGVRTRNGEWFERSLGAAPDSGRVIAAGNDDDFVVVTRAGLWNSPTIAHRLDSRGRLLSTTEIPFAVRAAAPRGDDFVLAGQRDREGVIATFSKSGVLSPPVKFVDDAGSGYMAVAVSGTTTLVTWTVRPQCPFACPAPDNQITVLRLDSALRPLEQPRSIGSSEFSGAKVTASGNEFVLAWSESDKLRTIRIPVTGDWQGDAWSVTRGMSVRGADVLATPAGVVYAWQTYDLTRSAFHLLPGNGEIAGPDRPPVLSARRIDLSPLLAVLPNGDIGLFATAPNLAAPHHGARRVMMIAASFTGLGTAPDAPRLTASRTGGPIRLEWSAPPQPVNGYRVEYRIGDGSWNELDEWFTANDLVKTLPWQQPVVAFRVRAFNDAGASDYSQVAAVGTGVGKRRAVR
jgi:hypothetical protein